MLNPYAPPIADVHDVSVAVESVAPAARLSRLGAAFIDGLIFMALVYAPMLLGSRSEDPTIALSGLAVALVGLIVFGLLNLRFVAANGQSIGKKMIGIKVVRSDGSRASLGRIFWKRNILNGLLSLIPVYGIVDALFIFSESEQCLHDRIADTNVINA